MITFDSHTFQNEYLPVGGTEMNAIVTVTAVADSDEAAAVDTEVIIVIDVSGSMNYPRAKLNAAKAATAEAIDCVRDGVRFGIVAGYERADVVYPTRKSSDRLAVASDATRLEAKKLVKKLSADGGTAIGAWLRCTRECFGTESGTVRQAILLTDGCNESEEPEDLDAAIADCEGRFQCDCRGVGADWDVDELRHISSRLLGDVDIIPDPGEMAAEFRAMMQRAMAKATTDVRLRVWTPSGAQVKFVKQVAPEVEDLSARRVEVDERTADYPTGAWGSETRDYHVCITVPAHDPGDDMLAGRVSLVVAGEPGSPARIRCEWTEDEALSTRINREVAHYTGQVELADAVQEGLAARKAGDLDTATVRLGRAVQLAQASGDEQRLHELARVVDIDDATTGTVRLRPSVEKLDEMVLETRSVKTMRVVRAPGP
jgi:hypothetical protein